MANNTGMNQFFSKLFAGLLLIGIICACDSQQPEPKPEHSGDKPAKFPIPITPVVVPKQKTLEARLASPEWKQRFHRPYRLVIHYCFLDTPNYRMFSHYFQTKITDLLPIGQEQLLQCDFRLSIAETQKLLAVEKLTSDFCRSHQGYEQALAITISLAEKQIKIRRVGLTTGRLSAILDTDFGYPLESIEVIAKELPRLLELEGYVVEVAAKDNITVVFRGNYHALDALKQIKPGAHFWLYRQDKRIRNCLIGIKKTYRLGDYLAATGEYLGIGQPRVGQKISQVYCPGGVQKFRVVDAQGHPQSGFSVFISYDNFTTHAQNYQCTTDTSGVFTLEDTRHKPLYLVIARNISEVNFAFIRQILVLQPNSSVEDIRIAEWETTADQSWKVIQDHNRSKKIREIQRQVQMRILEAKEYIQKKELGKAIMAIKLAQQQLQKLERKYQGNLMAAIEKMQKVYDYALEQKQAKENYIAACKLLEETDKDVKSIKYRQAQAKLQRADELWPHKFYAKTYREVSDRKQQLDRLIEELDKPVGKARQFLSTEFFQLSADQIDHRTLDQIYPHLKALFGNGQLKQDVKYNDRELWLRLRIFLNELSEKLASEAQIYLKKFDQARSEKERTTWFQKHQSNYQASRTIDKWLQTMQN